jgi:hypothetical protein
VVVVRERHKVVAASVVARGRRKAVATAVVVRAAARWRCRGRAGGGAVAVQKARGRRKAVSRLRAGG